LVTPSLLMVIFFFFFIYFISLCGRASVFFINSAPASRLNHFRSRSQKTLSPFFLFNSLVVVFSIARVVCVELNRVCYMPCVFSSFLRQLVATSSGRDFYELSTPSSGQAHNSTENPFLSCDSV
jgi:hypothetical protein